jgi:large subunit ribosomal protein L35
MPKAKRHKSLLKRITISKTGKARHMKAGFKHLRSAKSPDRRRRLRKGGWVDSADTKRLSRMVFQRIRGKSQPRSAITRSPNPEERAERNAETREANKAAREAYFAQAQG